MANRKLKVVFIADIGSAHRTGGGQTFARLFLEGVAQHWKEVDLKVFLYQKPADKGTVISQISEETASKIIPILIATPDYSIGHPLTDLSFILKARSHIRAINADFYILDQPNALLMSLPPKPSMTIFHGNICSFVNYKPNPFQFRRLIKKALWQRVFVKILMLRYLRNGKNFLPIFNSLYSLNGSLECVPGLNQRFLETLAIGLPVDTRMFFPSDELGCKYRESHGIQNDDVVLTYISNFAKKKLPNIVPEIITPFLKNKKIHFFFIGRSMDSNELDQFCEKHDNCHRITETPQNDVNGYINMSNILFSTSKTETFGYTIAEGMLCGKPNVVFSEGAQVEYIEHRVNGMIANNNCEFTQYLELLISDESLQQQLGQEARKTILQKFDLKKYMENLSQIVEEKFGFNPL